METENTPAGRRLRDLAALMSSLPRLGADEAEAFSADLERFREDVWTDRERRRPATEETS